MCGTDSRDYAAKDVFVPHDMVASIFDRKSFFDTPAAALPIRVALATPHAAVAVGIARGALDDLAALATTKRAAMNPAALLADDPVFRHTLGEQTLRLAGVEAMMHQVARDAEQAAAEGRTLTPTETLLGRSMAAYVTAECVKVVDAAYNFGGSTSVYAGSSLQRRLRDLHVATQHLAASPEAYRVLAAAVLGEELSPRDLF
jgi:alkylation response protein AidB-like acyl-CoA dehydrogenase